MDLQSKFNIGDIVCANIKINGERKTIGPYTIGLIRVELVDSPGIPGEQIFDNYKPQKKRTEQYMLVETGIISGTVYIPEQLHLTEESAIEARKKL